MSLQGGDTTGSNMTMLAENLTRIRAVMQNNGAVKEIVANMDAEPETHAEPETVQPEDVL